MKAIFLLPILFMSSCQENVAADKNNAVCVNLSSILEMQYLNQVKHEPETCLPIPTNEFLSNLREDSLVSFRPENEFGFVTDEIYYYLINHLDSLGSKDILKLDIFWGPYEWTQNFEMGIEYYHIDYLEIGRGGELHTQCINRQEFFYVVDQLIKVETSKSGWNPNYQWNRDSTSFEPQNEGPGCRYKIARDSLNYFCLEWTCAC